jgi:hypothetical protein
LPDTEIVVLAGEAGPPDTGGGPPPPPADAGPADAPEDVALPARDLGNVFLTSGAYDNGAVETIAASAAFFTDVSQSGCSVQRVGGAGDSCTLEICAPPTGPQTLSNAGIIQVSGGAFPLVMQQDSTGGYDLAVDGGLRPLWLGGESLTIDANGADVPPFTARLTAPTQIIFTLPFPTMITRTQPVALEWLGDSGGKVAFDLAVTASSTRTYLECRFDPAAKQGIVPTRVLSLLPASATATLSISTLDQSDVHAGGWLVKTFAQTYASDQSGAACNALVDLQ